MKRGHDILPPEQHKRLGATLFNHLWDLMEKEGKTTEEDAEMIRDVQAMRFHWNEVGTARNKAVSEWQTARVYSLLKMPESALYHANRCLVLTTSGGEGSRISIFPLPTRVSLELTWQRARKERPGTICARPLDWQRR